MKVPPRGGKSVDDIFREMLGWKEGMEREAVADRLCEIGRKHGFEVSRGGTPEFPEVTFDKQQVIYFDREQMKWICQ